MASFATLHGGDFASQVCKPYENRYFAEYERVLKPGGWIVVAMPEETRWLQQQACLSDRWCDVRDAAVSDGFVYAFRLPSGRGSEVDNAVQVESMHTRAF